MNTPHLIIRKQWHFKKSTAPPRTSQVALWVKNPPDNAREVRDSGWIPGSGRSPGGGHGNPLQHSCLEYPMDRGAWWATVYSVARGWTRLSDLACTH